MNASKRRRLEEAGWTSGDAAELLDLKPDEAVIVELRVDLAVEVRRLRAKFGVTQAQLAKRLGSTQPKVSDLEHGKGSLEQMVRALVALGAGRRELARAVAAPST